MFRGKLRKPVTLTLTPEHHEKVSRNKRRLNCTRADLIGLLIEKYADQVTAQTRTYGRLIDAVEVLGGSLEFDAWNGPLGGTWWLTLGSKRLPLPSRRNADLDACYRASSGEQASRAIDDGLSEINPKGLAELLGQLAAQPDA